MALIKCSECGKEIGDTIAQCPHCGYRIKKKNPINKKMLIVSVVIVVMVCVICVIKMFSNNDSPANQAINIIEADFGKKVNIIAIYYNEEQNGCIIEFTSNGMSDVACVHLDDKSIGYESMFDKMAEVFSEKINDPSLSDKEKQNYAKQAVEYPYDAAWVYNLHRNGTRGSGWEKVK